MENYGVIEELRYAYFDMSRAYYHLNQAGSVCEEKKEEIKKIQRKLHEAQSHIFALVKEFDGEKE